jgi:hypothetical protein
MRPIVLSPVPPTAEAQIKWLIDAVQQIARASREADPNSYADGFTLSNVTNTRTLNADTATLAQVADVLGTFISDHKSRGSKRTT